MKNNFKNIIRLAMLVCIILAFSGCGKKESDGNIFTIPSAGETVKKTGVEFNLTYKSFIYNADYDKNEITLVSYNGSEDEISIPNIIDNVPVTRILSDCFRECGASKIIIPSTVAEIEQGAFFITTDLKSIEVNEKNQSYSSENGALFNKDKTELIVYPSGNANSSYTVPNQVTKINPYAFSYVGALTEVVLPDALSVIPDFTFYTNPVLSRIELGSSVCDVSGLAFFCCEGINEIAVSEENKSFKHSKNALLSISGSKLIYYFPAASGGENVVISDVEEIGDFAFYNVKSVTSVSLSEGVERIGQNAFAYSDIEFFTLPDSLVSIGKNAFNSCSKFKKLELSNGLESIGQEAFSNCIRLEKINLPESVTAIGDACFRGDNALASVSGGEGLSEIPGYCFAGCSGLSELSVEGDLTKIGECAFLECKALSKLLLGGNYTEIGANAFDTCQSLKTLPAPEGLLTIGDGAFANCTGLTKAVLPESVTSIGENVFYNCKGIKEAVIGDKITNIDDECFYNCTSLESVKIGAGVTKIDDAAFYNCTSLKKIVVPNSVLLIRDYAFYGCGALESVKIGNSTSKICYASFADCVSLEKIDFGSGVKIIEQGAFTNDEAIKTVTFPEDFDKENVKIHESNEQIIQFLN